jgi:transposase
MAKKSDGRKMSKPQQEQARRQAMRLLDEGWTQKRTSQAVGVGERTVRLWVRYRRDHGLKALVRDERGRKTGEGRTLSAAQEKGIRRLILDQAPDQLKLPFALWTRKAVGQLIQQRYGLRLPVRTLGEYLKRWGFTVQKPVQKALEQKPAAVRRWLRQEYPAIAAQAKAAGAEIYWGDQTGCNNQPNGVRGYAPQGQTPQVTRSARRFTRSVMSAVTNRGSLRWMVYKGALNAARLIEFLRRLVRQAGGRKVCLILDNLRVHHSVPVKAWVAAHAGEITVHHLPSYSPELNPDEWLNRSLKSKLAALPAPRTEAQLHRQTIAQLRSCHKQPALITRCFSSLSTTYAA